MRGSRVVMEEARLPREALDGVEPPVPVIWERPGTV
jgi:hypothetical protein